MEKSFLKLLSSILFIYLAVSVPSQAYALVGSHSYTNETTGDVFLGGDYIELGISKLGSFGTSTGQGKPAGFYGTANRNNIGMASNAAGWGETPDTRIDYFLPGNPEERWVVGYKISGSATTASNTLLNGSSGISNNVVTNQSSGDNLKATSVGTLNNRLKITQVISFKAGDKYFRNIVTLQNVGDTTLDNVRYMRSFDPDNTGDKGGSSSTNNQILFTHAAGDEKAVVMADTSNNNSDPVYLVNGSRSPILFFSLDERARVSTFGFGNTDPYAAAAYDSPDAKGTSEVDDQAITITVDVGTLSQGQSSQFIYYTSLDNRDFEEVIGEIEEEAALNNPPDAPTLASTFSLDGSATSSAQPTFLIQTSDPDATNSARHRIQIDETEDFSSPLIDFTSDLLPQGWNTFRVGQGEASGQYTNGAPSQTLGDGSYYLRVKAIDDFGAESDYVTAHDGEVAFVVNTNSPAASDPETETASTSATLAWTTDEATSSQIEYGLVPEYGFLSEVEDSSPRVTEHEVELTGLKSCARYYYRTISRNNAGTPAYSEQKTFVTTGCTYSTIEEGVEENISKDDGGELEITINSTRLRLTVPENFADESASFQINQLDDNEIPLAPPGKTVIPDTFVDLIAVTDDNDQLAEFDEPLTFVVTYPESLEDTHEEATLDLYYFDGTDWSAMECTVDTSANTLTCQLEHFSTYAVFGVEKQYADPDRSSSSTEKVASCGDPSPVTTPDLFQVDRSPTSATIYFTPDSSTPDFFISYGESESADAHAVIVKLSMEGVQSYTLNDLQGYQSYYIKVRPMRGCQPGNWSNTFLSEPPKPPVPAEVVTENMPSQPEETVSEEDERDQVAGDATPSATVGATVPEPESPQDSNSSPRLFGRIRDWFQSLF